MEGRPRGHAEVDARHAGHAGPDLFGVKKQKEVEVVKSSVSELPRLPEWRSDTAPLDLSGGKVCSKRPGSGMLSTWRRHH